MHLRSLISWDMASLDHYKGVLVVIEEWNKEIQHHDSPSKKQGRKKKAKSFHAAALSDESDTNDLDAPKGLRNSELCFHVTAAKINDPFF